MAVDQQTRRLNASELINCIIDPGSYRSWDQPVTDPPCGADYANDLSAARARTGVDESVLTGEGTIQGRRVALIVSEFRFLGGSIGLAAAARIVTAVERATREGLPLLAAPASGGTRMQEGTIAFIAMVRISTAVRAHRQAGLPYIVYLRHPTTGGVMASWGSLGHLTLAEPSSMLGFLGPRVYEALHNARFPENVQVAENLLIHGLIDAVVPPERVADTVAKALATMLATPHQVLPEPETLQVRPSRAGAWESITISRNPARPGLRELLAHAATDVLPLHSTGQGEKDSGLLLALARFGQAGCIVIGHTRPATNDVPAMGPAALREARRGMQLAEELGLPVLTVIDTAGAALSKEAEEGGLAGEIARSIYDLVGLKTPSVSVLLGQGAGGGALALLPADRTIAAHHAWLSPLPPEGASAILYRTTGQAPAVAQAQQVNVAALHQWGIVDHLVGERPDAALESAAFCRRLGTAIEYELSGLALKPSQDFPAQRIHRFLALDALNPAL